MESFLLFYLLIHSIDATDYSLCTNASLGYNIPVVSFCKASTAYNRVIVLDGHYAHTNTGMTTCTCIARGQVNQTISFIHAVFTAFVLSSQCNSEIQVKKDNTTLFIMSCINTLASLTFGSNGEISIVLTKQEATADTRYCIQVQSDLNSDISITCEAHSDITHVQTTDIQTSPTTTYVNISTEPGNTPLQTTTTVSVDKTVTQPICSINDKSRDGLIVSTGTGWFFCVVFAVTIIILFCQRRCCKQITKGPTNRSVTYDDLRSRDVRNYSTMGSANTGFQEYEIVTANNV